jgi:ABC-type multidrug transport system ATPase subunit
MSESVNATNTTVETEAKSTATTEPPIVEIDGLGHTYGRIAVLEDVSFDVRPGEVTAIVGPNGAGKTTLIRDVVGLQEPTAGTVNYRTPDVPRPIGYLQQRPAFRPGQSVEQAISFYGSLVGETEADAARRLERVGLGAATDRAVEALSGGMTRLAGIAQATVGDPSLVVLDEPASGLDPGMSVRIFEIAEGLAATGSAVLVSSHNLALVERTADRVVLLDDGTVARIGSPADLKGELGAESLLDAFEAAVTGDSGTVSVRGDST